jgi:hypothetical protein
MMLVYAFVAGEEYDATVVELTLVGRLCVCLTIPTQWARSWCLLVAVSNIAARLPSFLELRTVHALYVVVL